MNRIAGVPVLFGRPTRLALGGLLAMLIVTAGGWLFSRHDRPPPPVERSPSGVGPRAYADARMRLDRDIEGASETARAQNGQWLAEERLAQALIARGRLTGSFGDYAAAQAALDRGFADASPGTGPHQVQMALDFAMHRLARAETMARAIDRYAVPDRATQLEAALTRGDLAFYRGDYAGAIDAYRKIAADGDDPGALLRLANALSRTGRPDEALALIDRCERTARLPGAQLLADLALRRGTIELQRGRWSEASHHFDRAARLFPGWWLADAHRAQILALTGQDQKAIAAFLSIARRSGNPEAMDALASLYRAAGDRDKSTFWADQARMIWNDRLRLFPEAGYGHAVEHILAFGDPAAALEIARKDHANRPYGMTATALGWALIANNQPARALSVIDPVLRSSWVSPESHLAAAQAHLLLGQIGEAEAARKAALAIDPHAADRTASLSWFGH